MGGHPLQQNLISLSGKNLSACLCVHFCGVYIQEKKKDAPKKYIQRTIKAYANNFTLPNSTILSFVVTHSKFKFIPLVAWIDGLTFINITLNEISEMLWIHALWVMDRKFLKCERCILKKTKSRTKIWERSLETFHQRMHWAW